MGADRVDGRAISPAPLAGHGLEGGAMLGVVLSLVAVVLLVLVVVALGMRSMNNRESSLDPERLKALVERDEQTQTRSTDQFMASEPRMNNFSPDFSPIDEHKQPKIVRTGTRARSEEH